MKSPSSIERLLYTTLLVVFIGVGIGLFATINFNQKLQAQVHQLQALTKAQSATSEEIQGAVNTIKGNQGHNTQYLVCIADHIQLGENTASCTVPAQ